MKKELETVLANGTARGGGTKNYAGVGFKIEFHSGGGVPLQMKYEKKTQNAVHSFVYVKRSVRNFNFPKVYLLPSNLHRKFSTPVEEF